MSPADRLHPMRVMAWPAFKKQHANPHAALLATALQNQGVRVDDWTPLRALFRSVDIWHLHHPDTVVYPRSSLISLIGVLVFAGLLMLAQHRRTRILWTIHDFDNNDGLHPRLEAWLWRFFLPRVDACICLTDGGVVRARERFPQLNDKPAYVVAHGHYLDAYPNSVSRDQARDALGLPADALVMLHFGLMRPYKNVPHLIDTFGALTLQDSVLLIAGKPYDDRVEREIREHAAVSSRVQLRLQWIPPDTVQHYFMASDLVVLPYRRIVNSGAVLLALSFARPVLVPDLGNMREQQQTFGASWIRLYEGDLTSDILADACHWAVTTERPRQDLHDLSWEQLAEQTINIYRQMLEKTPEQA